MRAAIIESGVVANVVRIDDADFAEAQGWIVSDQARIGDAYDAATGAFSAPTSPDGGDEAPAEITRDDLRARLSEVHDAYLNGTTQHRGVSIAIDVEARVNARGTLDEVRSGQQPVPFEWFAGAQALTISSEAEMQAVHDAIYGALRRGYNAKGKVLAAIDAVSDPSSYDVAVAYRAHL